MSDPLYFPDYCVAVNIVDNVHNNITQTLYNFIKRVESDLPELLAVEDIDADEDNTLFELVWEARRDVQVNCLSVLCDNDVATEITFGVDRFCMDCENYIVTPALLDPDSWPSEIEKIRVRVMELIDEQNAA